MKIQNNRTKNKQYIKIGILGAVVLLALITVPTMYDTTQTPKTQAYAQSR